MKLLGYRQLLEPDGCQVNSESLPDLKWPRAKRAVGAFGHSVSDPSLARRPSGRKGVAPGPATPPDRRRKDDGSTSDCSDQSGWVSSSAASSRPDSPPPPAGLNGRTDNPYPDVDHAPLAPPEEFQVLIHFIKILTFNPYSTLPPLLSSLFQISLNSIKFY